MTAFRHLTPADYLRQPWANGRGETLEIARAEGPGGLLWRLSIATVAEDGPFSRLPGLDRSLTVIDGPGFDLNGPGWCRRAAHLTPVTFPGDHAVTASGVAAPSRDFNVMVARGRMRALVACGPAGRTLQAALVVIHLPDGGGLVLDRQAIFTGPGDTIMAEGPCIILPETPVLAVALDAMA
jgi:uncharacterized protein